MNTWSTLITVQGPMIVKQLNSIGIALHEVSKSKVTKFHLERSTSPIIKRFKLSSILKFRNLVFKPSDYWCISILWEPLVGVKWTSEPNFCRRDRCAVACTSTKATKSPSSSSLVTRWMNGTWIKTWKPSCTLRKSCWPRSATLQKNLKALTTRLKLTSLRFAVLERPLTPIL